MRIAIFEADSNGCFPVPAVKGGAVSALVEHILEKCNEHNEYDITMYSYYDPRAVDAAKHYPNIHFEWIRIPGLIRWLDVIFYKSITALFPNKKAISFLSLCSLLWYILKCSCKLRKHSYDKVFLENNVIISWIIKLSGYKGWYCYHLHNLPRTMAGARKVFEDCNAFYSVSHFMSLLLSSNQSPILQLPIDKCEEYYNCIDTDHFVRCSDEMLISQYREKFRLSLEDKTLIFVGRLSEEKGIDKLLEAVKLLNDKSIRILITGALIYNSDKVDGYILKLRKLAEDLNGQVIFTGYIGQDELPVLYSLSDIAVLPSVWDEPAGLTMIEAMACGTPLITCASGGIPEYVGDAAIVLDREENLVENISKNIRMLLDNPALRKDYSEKGMKRIKDNFNLDKYYENFKKIIESH